MTQDDEELDDLTTDDSASKIIEYQRRYERSPKGKHSKKKYFKSNKGKEALRRYIQSPKGAEAQLRYALSDKGQQARQKVMSKQQLFRACEQWLQEHPGSSASDFFEQTFGKGDGSNGSKPR